jgi:hypothetical protein
VAVTAPVHCHEDTEELLLHIQDDTGQRQVEDQVRNVREPQPHFMDACRLIAAVAAVPLFAVHWLALDLER